MINTVIGAVAGLLIFIIPLWAYRRGLKDGLALSDGAKTIEPIPTPLQVIETRRETKEAKAETDRMLEGMHNIFSYDGNKQLGGDKD